MFGCGVENIASGSFSLWAFFPMIFRTLVFVGLIYLAIKLFKNNSTNTKNNSAISILNEKYASGEISEDEYIKRKNVLNQSK